MHEGRWGGLYETMLVDQGRVRLLDRHLARLSRAGVGTSEVDEVANLITQACAQRVEPTVHRIDVIDGKVTPKPRPPRPATPVHLVSCLGYDPGEEVREYKRVDRSWAEPAEAFAIRRGAGEALLIGSDGMVGETTRANLFALLGGELITPPVRGLLPGVTRSWVIDTLDAVERSIFLPDLRTADAVFLTTAGRGVVAVTAIDGDELPANPLVADLQERWRDLD